MPAQSCSKKTVLTPAQWRVVRFFELLAEADRDYKNAQERQETTGSAGADGPSEDEGIRGARRQSRREGGK